MPTKSPRMEPAEVRLTGLPESHRAAISRRRPQVPPDFRRRQRRHLLEPKLLESEVGPTVRSMGDHSGSTARTGRRSFALLLGVLPLLGLTGCLTGDPPPDPSVAPLEIVVESSQGEEDCLLNRESVAAGTHEVTVISQGQPAAVRILDESGEVVFTDSAVTGGVGPDEGSPSVELDSGRHVVECIPEGGTSMTVPLQVDP